ncbi:immunoglobulin domain-containing protein [Roseibacillus ishigakijimensis]|nr:immunoglobulin domain-containing protein [Roseibacillus ishigakijimensis]
MKKYLFPGLVGQLVCGLLGAAPDSVDPAFAASAGSFYEASEFGGVASTLVQPDGKLLIGSNEMLAVGGIYPSLIRFNGDGSVDETFAADDNAVGEGNGIRWQGQGWPEVHALGLQSDGKIIAAGVMNSYRDATLTGTEYLSSIIRFQADGSYDETFLAYGTQPDGGLNYIEEVTVQPDDMVICVGGFRGFRNKADASYTPRYGIARLQADGSLDSGFEVLPGDFGVPAGATNISGFFRHAAVDAGGKIYVVGEWSWGNTFPKESLPVFARLHSNGALDPAFQAAVPTGIDSFESVVLEPNGEITLLARKSDNTSYLARFQPNGQLSPSFSLAPGLSYLDARPLRRDPQGKFILSSAAGYGAARDTLIRLNNDGSLDGTFHPSASWVGVAERTAYFSSVVTAPSGRIFSGSFFDRVQGTETVKIVAFEGESLPAEVAWAATAPRVVESAGVLSLVVYRSGAATSAASVDYAFAAGSAGAEDFSPASGTLTWAAGESGPRVMALTVLDDNLTEGEESLTVTLSNASGMAIAGPASATVTLIDDETAPTLLSQPASLTVKEGQPASFRVVVESPVPPTYQWFLGSEPVPGATGASLSLVTTSSAQAGDYTVVVSTPAGSVTSAVATLTVLPPAAAWDATFAVSGVTQPGSFQLLPDDSVLMLDGNHFDGYTLRKLDSTFTADETFTVTTTPASGYPENQAYPSPLALPQGKFLVEGRFSQVNGEERLFLARMNDDGSVDADFVPFFNDPFEMRGFTTSIQFLTGVEVTPTGQVYVMVRSASQGSGLFRLTAQGAIDASFAHGFNYSTNAALHDLVELPDGSILVGFGAGGFGTSQRGIRKILPDGAIDPAFSEITGLTTSVSALQLLSDGRFLAAIGNSLRVYSASGSLQESYTFSGTITSLQSYRGRILLTGVTAYEGVPLPGLALFSLDGSVDDNFPGGAGPNANVVNVHLDSQGRIVVQGGFTTWNGNPAPGLARLLVERAEVAFQTLSGMVLENAGTFALELVRYGDASAAASVRVVSNEGTALAGADFQALDEVVSWAAGESGPRLVTVTLLDDSDLESEEELSLHLSDPSGVRLVAGDFTLRLLDDDSFPQIAEQPSSQQVLAGSAASFTVVATSPVAMSYQWYFEGDLLPGATEATYAIPAASEAEEGAYHVVVSNEFGSTPSGSASLSILADPTTRSPLFTAPASPPSSGTVAIVVPAPDGGAYLGGSFRDFGGNADRDYLAKIHEDGSLDESFQPPVLSSQVEDLVVAPNGDLFVVGGFPGRLFKLAADGSEDTAFSANRGTGGDNGANAVGLLPDGSVMVAGDFRSWNGTVISAFNAPNSHLIRLNPDGTLHPARYPNPGHSNHYLLNSEELLVLPDGKILLSYDQTSGIYAKVRLYEPDGAEVTSFVYPFSSRRIDHFARFSDGDFLFAGDNFLAKVDATGAVVASYDTTVDWFSAAIQWDGKVIGARNANQLRLQRFLPDQQLDAIYDMGSKFNGHVESVALRADGRLWAAGQFSSFDGSPVPRVVLLENELVDLVITTHPADLILDPGETAVFTCEAVGTSELFYQWAKNGEPLPGETAATLTLPPVEEENEGRYTCTVTNESGFEISQEARLIVLGAPEIVSLSEDVVAVEGNEVTLRGEALGAGTLNYQWQKNGSNLPGETRATLTFSPVGLSDQAGYRLVVSNDLGSITSESVTVTVDPNSAAPHPDFAALTLQSGSIWAIQPLPGGNVLVGGDFIALSDGVNTSGDRLAVVSPAGEVLSGSSLSANKTVTSFYRQEDGKILLAGSFTAVNGQARGLAARLNADWTLDESFVPAGGGGFFAAQDILQDGDGKVLVCGDFADWGGAANTAYLARLNADGSVDPSFTSYANSFTKSVGLFSDGKYLIAGWFGDYGGSASADGLVRLNADGSLDESQLFNATSHFSGKAFLSSSGEVYSAPAFQNAIVKYSAEGDLEGGFAATFAANGKTLAFAEKEGGGLVLAGDFTMAHGESSLRIASVQADGTRVTAFQSGSGFDASVKALAVAEDGSLWVGGDFTTYNGHSFPGLLRLRGEAGATVSDPWEDFVAGLPSGQQGEDGDPDGDGVPNLLEYVYGTDPLASNPYPHMEGGRAWTGSAINAAVPGADLDPAARYWTIAFRFPYDSKGVTLTPQATRNLADFEDGSAQLTPLGEPVPEGDFYLQRYYFTPDSRSASRGFMRLRASRN